TDFFTPLVNDAFVFGQVAAANALSDVYAMGGNPIMALAILGWPVDKLPPELAKQVMEGAQVICNKVGIPIAGGHSIDSAEPVFGLSVNGRVKSAQLKNNHSAKPGNLLLMTKPIGTGILASACKKGLLTQPDETLWFEQITQVNTVGSKVAEIAGVTAMTDITGFGLVGHALEMAKGSNLSLTLQYSKVPVLEAAKGYMAQNCIPDATYRNWNAYQPDLQINAGVSMMEAFKLLPDPQTNGGLLIAVEEQDLPALQVILAENGYEAFIQPIGYFTEKQDKFLVVNE
ncbi:MAG: selenide, water dikinase SelD, partial [Chitinophagaceae bacterium]